MRALGEASSRLARRAVALAEGRRGVGIVLLVALAVWWLEALVIPLGPGRDFGTYLGAYAQLFHSHPIDLGYVLGRTPIAPVVAGGLLDLWHGALAEPAMSLLYAGSLAAWFVAARSFGARAAVLVVVVLLAYPGYGILFHELSSDSIFAAAFAGWSLLAVRALLAPSWRRFALAGAGVGVLVLVRPSSQALLVLALVPLLAAARSWRGRLVATAAFLVPALALTAGWALHNGLRYGEYWVARGGNATVPFYRAYVTDRIVRPSNGPASRELAAAVRRDLLPREPYRSYGITLDRFFTAGSARMQEDLVALSDRVKGFDTNQRWLRDVGVEAVRAHPFRYARGVAGSLWGLGTDALYRDLTPRQAPGAGTASAGGVGVVAGGPLPRPSEGQPIPAPHEGGVATKDGSIYTVWTSPTDHHLVFTHRGDAARYAALHRRIDSLAENLPHRTLHASLANRLNQLSKWFPPPVVWLVLGLAAFVLRRPRDPLAVALPTIAGLVVVLVSALGLPAEPHYTVPVAPAFVLLAGAGLLARRRSPVAAHVPSRADVGVALGAVAALWGAWTYWTKLRGAGAGGEAPHDLAVFLQAAGKVVAGASPYAFAHDATYAYPPLLAFLAEPFHALGTAAATVLWLVLLLAAVGGALWLLGVRDWRCYALAAVYPTTRSAVDLGTVEPLLLLLVAAAWRWRDRVVEPALAVGAAVALKLFLWPIAIWLAVTGRIRAAAASVAAAAVLVLLPWGAIGFAGLGGYSGLLHRLSDEEATSSYSLTALVVRAHLPETVGVVLSLLVAAGFLFAAALVARRRLRAGRDRDAAALTLVLAAALAASPIVWIHYFLFLLVPVALARPRLSPLWLVPLAYYPLGETAWPAGDARKLGLALVTTLVLLVATLRPAERASATPEAAAPPARLRPGPARLTRAR